MQDVTWAICSSCWTPTVFMSRHEFETPIQKLCAGIKQSEPLPGVPRILIPGQLEEERRHIRLRDGNPVLADVLEALEGSCRKMGMTPPLEGQTSKGVGAENFRGLPKLSIRPAVTNQGLKTMGCLTVICNKAGMAGRSGLAIPHPASRPRPQFRPPPVSIPP